MPLVCLFPVFADPAEQKVRSVVEELTASLRRNSATVAERSYVDYYAIVEAFGRITGEAERVTAL